MFKNMAARLVSFTTKHDYITHIYRDNLHWLLVNQRIYFKILLLTYKGIPLLPLYKSQVINVNIPLCCLREGSIVLSMIISKIVRTKTYDERAFVVATSILWHDLPESAMIATEAMLRFSIISK